MWQAPSSRGRAGSRRKSREKNRRPLHLRRVVAELKTVGLGAPQTLLEARIVLNDISPLGMGLFVDQALEVGQDIAITLEHPRRIYIRGRVTWCEEHSTGTHILSNRPFQYRMGIQFIFQSDQERDAVRAFCEHLSKEHLHTNTPIAA